MWENLPKTTRANFYLDGGYNLKIFTTPSLDSTGTFLLQTEATPNGIPIRSFKVVDPTYTHPSRGLAGVPKQEANASRRRMTFYLLSEGLTCVGIFSGAYESLKVLSRVEKGVDSDTLAAVLEFWIVLAAIAIFEQYVEFFISWFPFYYLFKCALLGLLLTPNKQFRHLLFEGFIRPAVVVIKDHVDTTVVPMVESLVIRHGHWFNQKLMERSLQLASNEELLEFEQDLQKKLTQVQSEIRGRKSTSKQLED